MSLIWNNFASAQLALPAGLGDTTLTVGLGEGAVFPQPTGAEEFILVVEDESGVKEIMTCQSVVADVLTVTRGQEGTSALDFIVGSRVEVRMTAGWAQNFVDGGDF